MLPDITLSLCALTLFACGPSSPAAHDASIDASTVPRSPEGTFAVASQLDLVAIPPPAIAIIAELQAATDGPDDPARYLVDRMIAALPDGDVKLVASGLAPFLAPYVQAKLSILAPRFAPGVRALADGLGSIARHVGTIEVVTIAHDGSTTRAIVGLQLGSATIELRNEGLADTVGTTHTELDRDGTLAIGAHRVQLQYGRLLRLGLDRAVIPGVDPSTIDLARALRDLVDCRALGALVADHAGFGWTGLYEAACNAGMSALATEIYARFDAIDALPFELSMTGTARGIDANSDGTMDTITRGAWTGTASYAGVAAPLGAASFEGHK